MTAQKLFEKKKQFLLKQEFYFLMNVSLRTKLSHQQLKKYKPILVWWNIESNVLINWNTDILDEFKDIFFDANIEYPEINYNESLPWSIEFIERYKDLWRWLMLIDNPTVMKIPGIKEHFSEQFLPYVEDYPEVFIPGFEKQYWVDPIEWQYESIKEISNFDFIDWRLLSHNKRLFWSQELIEQYQYKLVWSALSSNPTLPWSVAFIEKYGYRWDWTNLSGNEGVPWTIGLIKKYENKFNWWKHDKNNDNGTPIGIGISANQGIKWDKEILSTYINKLNPLDISFSRSAKWDIDLLTQFADFWDYQTLASNKIVWDNVFPEFNNAETIDNLLDIILERRINELKEKKL